MLAPWQSELFSLGGSVFFATFPSTSRHKSANPNPLISRAGARARGAHVELAITTIKHARSLAGVTASVTFGPHPKICWTIIRLMYLVWGTIWRVILLLGALIVSIWYIRVHEIFWCQLRFYAFEIWILNATALYRTPFMTRPWGGVWSRLRHLIDRSGEFCVHYLIAFSLRRREWHNEHMNNHKTCQSHDFL